METKEYDSMTSSFSSITKKTKLEKYWNFVSSYFKLNNDITLEEAEKILKKFEQERSNPMQAKFNFKKFI